MNRDIVSALLTAPLLCLLALGCRDSSGPTPSEYWETAQSWDGPYVQRLARDILDRERGSAVVLVPETGVWTTGADGSWSVPQDLETAAFGLARIQMSTEDVSRVELTWTSTYEPELSDNPGIDIPLVADGMEHEYTVPLTPDVAPTWVDTITSIGIRVVEGAGPVRISTVAFEPPEEPAPTRITLLNETREAVFGSVTQPDVLVPPGGQFETGIGLYPTKRARSGGVRATFSVFVDAADGSSVRVANGSVRGRPQRGERTWKDLRGDLSRYAGQTVTLRLVVDLSEATAGFYPYWGAPRVYSEYGMPDATPVILISCDTARADHFSVYGYERETSPYLERFAKDAVVFEHAFTEETWTLPSHATMFTGLHPNDHGVTPQAHLAESARTLAEIVSAESYHTVGYMSSRLWFLPQRGLHHGFDVWNIPHGGPPYIREIFDTFHLPKEWIETRGVNNFLLFAHNIDAHVKPSTQLFKFPYGPRYSRDFHFADDLGRAPKLNRQGDEDLYGWDFIRNVNQGNIALSDYEHDYVVALYDDAIRYVDRGIASLLETLKEAGLYDDALIIVTADHGEGLAEHGSYGHDNVFEPNARIPFIVKFPGNRFGGERRTGLVQLHDVMPTILDVLDIPVPGGVTGTSLLEVLEGSASLPEFAYVQRYDQRAVRSQGFKYVFWDGLDEGAFYDLASDPLEAQDVSSEHPEAVAAFHREKERFFGARRPGWHFRISAPNTPGSLRVNSTYPIEKADFVRFDRSGDKKPFTISQLEDSIEIVWEAGFADEIVLRTMPVESAVTVALTLDSTLPVRTGDEDVLERDSLQAELAPDEGIAARQAIAGEGVEIWFQPSAETVASTGMDPELEAELGALGYLGGNQESAITHDEDSSDDNE